MNVNEVAHTNSEVDGSPARGDFDLAPGPMHIDEHEKVGGPIALVFTVVALDLARLSRDRLAHFSNQLDRALVEADHWAFRIGMFRVEIEHILHAGDVFGIDPWDAPHVLAPRLEVIFGQASAYGFAG